MGFFDLFKDPLERHLEQVYIPSYRMMGMSEQESAGDVQGMARGRKRTSG